MKALIPFLAAALLMVAPVRAGDIEIAAELGGLLNGGASVTIGGGGAGANVHVDTPAGNADVDATVGGHSAGASVTIGTPGGSPPPASPPSDGSRDLIDRVGPQSIMRAFQSELTPEDRLLIKRRCKDILKHPEGEPEGKLALCRIIEGE